MKTQMKLFVVVVCFAVCIGTTWAKTKEDKAKDSAASTDDAAAPTADAPGPSVAEKSESFAQWAYHKISG